MKSKKIGSPLASIFQQWTAQQRQETSTNSPHSPSAPFSTSNCYRILLQTSYSLQSRIAAAEPVENLHLYTRAGVQTPSERALRDIHGGSETGWLLRLVELAVQQQQEAESQNGEVSSVPKSLGAKVIFVKTKGRSKDTSIITELPAESQRKIHLMDFAASDPYGWDDDAEDGVSSDEPNLHNLAQVYQRLKDEFRGSSAPVILIWQSLTPLILLHGFQKVLRLLCALPSCLQVWPINLHIITPKEHAQLEDAANALLCMHGGEMNITRQGIRERGNILRQKIPFRLVPLVDECSGKRRFRVVEGTDDDQDLAADIDGGISGNKFQKSQGEETTIPTDTATERSFQPSRGAIRSRGMPIRIEENDGGRNNEKERPSTETGVQEELSAPITRPRIYLQDDDPEFNDFDEEDPDDDLEI